MLRPPQNLVILINNANKEEIDVANFENLWWFQCEIFTLWHCNTYNYPQEYSYPFLILILICLYVVKKGCMTIHCKFVHLYMYIKGQFGYYGVWCKNCLCISWGMTVHECHVSLYVFENERYAYTFLEVWSYVDFKFGWR